MHMDMLFLWVSAIAVLIAAVSKAGFGGGGSFVATPILALVAPPEFAVALLLPLLLVMDVAALRAYWGKWNRREVRRLCLGAVPGVILAALVHKLTNPDVLKFLIGAIAVGFVLFQGALARRWIRARPEPLPASAGVAAGVVGGFTSFVSHAGGPPVVMYLLSQGLTKVEFQATTVLAFAIINLVKTVPYAMLGFFTTQTLWAILFLTPVALIGAWLGVRANHVVPERVFFGVTYVLLAVAGTKLMIDAVS